MGVGAEKACGKAAVSVTQDQGIAAVGEFAQIVDPAAPEKWAKGQIFKPSVGAGKVVEVRDSRR
jgi:hypothetical protein